MGGEKMMDVTTPPTSTIEEPQTVRTGKKFLPRAGAYLIDVLASLGLAVVSINVAALILRFMFEWINNVAGYRFYFEEVNRDCFLIFVGFIVDILYFSSFEWLYGRTLGKIILGMRVISINGKNITFKQAVTRSASRIIDSFFFGLVALASMKPPLFQRVGDQFAGTMVVSIKEPGISKAPEEWKFLVALAIFLFLEVIVRMLIYLIDIHIY
jgi:uncharacterized RDD family membrane protein YckC